MSEPPITPPLQRVSQQRDYDRADLIAVTGIAMLARPRTWHYGHLMAICYFLGKISVKGS
jgi:hypothetical protein